MQIITNSFAYQRKHNSECWIKVIADLYHRLHTTPVRIKLGLVSDDLWLVNEPCVVDGTFTHIRTSTNTHTHIRSSFSLTFTAFKIDLWKIQILRRQENKSARIQQKDEWLPKKVTLGMTEGDWPHGRPTIRWSDDITDWCDCTGCPTDTGLDGV